MVYTPQAEKLIADAEPPGTLAIWALGVKAGPATTHV